MNHERSRSLTAGDQSAASPRRGVAQLASSTKNDPSFASCQQSGLIALLAGPESAMSPAIEAATPHRQGRRSFHLTHRRLLAGVLILQAGLSVRLVWANTAFEDEANYLYTGHLEWAHWLHGATSPTLTAFPTWLSGAPVVYPPLGAIADSLGGLAGARLLSLCFMLGASLCLYETTQRLLDRNAALFAVLCFAVLASTQLLGAFATYDPMAIFLMAFGTWLGVRAADAGMFARVPLLAGSGTMLALACAAKYATALWVPAALAVSAIAAWQACRFRTGVITCIVLSAWWAILIAGALKFAGTLYMKGILFTTLARATSAESPLLVLNQSFGLIWILIILSFLAVLASFSASRSVRAICVCTTVAGLLAPLNEARLHTTTSLWKHADFGAWFAAIAAGYLLARLAKIDARPAWSAVLVGVVAVSLAGSVHYATTMAVRWWPNSAGMIKALSFVRPSTGPIWMNAYMVGDYYLHDQVYPGQISGIGFNFPWWDSARRTEITGAPAVVLAIKSRYFAVIEIDGQAATPAEYEAALRQIPQTPGYQLIYKKPWTYHGDRFYEEVWKRVNA